MASIAVTQAASARLGALRRRAWTAQVGPVLYVAVIAGAVGLPGAAFSEALAKLAMLGANFAVNPAKLLALFAAGGDGHPRWSEPSPFLTLHAALVWGSTILLGVRFARWPQANRQLRRGAIAVTIG